MVDSSPSWWLTEEALALSVNLAIADSGTMVVALLLSTWPVAWSRRPGLAAVPVALDAAAVLPVAAAVAAVARAGT